MTRKSLSVITTVLIPEETWVLLRTSVGPKVMRNADFGVGDLAQ